MQTLTLQNPKWVDNNRLGRWNRGVPQYLRFYTETSDGLQLPRGCMRRLINACYHFGISFEIEDRRRQLPAVDFSFDGRLKPFQQRACDAMLKKDFGVLTAPTGAGKTVMGLYLLTQRGQPALIVVHTRELLHQWVSRIETFTGLPADDIGLIGDGKFDIGEKITVGMVQTLLKRAPEVVPHIGTIIVDECHHAPSRTFHECVAHFDCKYMIGLSATPWRRDRLSRLIFWFLGDQGHEVEKSHLIRSGDILEAEVIIRETDFKPAADPSVYYTRVMSELVEDKERNHLITADIAQEARQSNGICLVLSDRKVHCSILQSYLKYNHKIESELLVGSLTQKQRKAVLKRLEERDINVLVATGQLVGEGFDLKALSVLFLTMPIKFSGRLMQYLGRVLRTAPGKKQARVYDYVDVHVGVLEAAARARRQVYEAG
jgi:superfamily II DNA or RNA helicase